MKLLKEFEEKLIRKLLTLINKYEDNKRTTIHNLKIMER